jgi:hypothetical protein
VVLAMGLLLLAKLATVYVPVIYGRIVDALAPKDNTALLAVPLGLVIGYGLVRWPPPFGELRDALFAKVQQRAVRTAARRTSSICTRSACAPSRPADRAGPCDRPRLAGHPVGAAARGVQRRADGDRAAASHRDHLASVRLALRRDHLRRV